MPVDSLLSKIIIVSDGSASPGGERGAAACLIKVPGDISWVKLALYLGSADSTDSEILAGLLGFAYLNAQPKEAAAGRAVAWVSDNQGVIEAAVKRVHQWRDAGWQNKRGAAVRKRGLWEAFLCLSASMELQSLHVSEAKPLSMRHRACDKASRWIEQKGENLLADSGEGSIGKISTIDPSRAWYLLDGRELMLELNKGLNVESSCRKFVNRLKLL